LKIDLNRALDEARGSAWALKKLNFALGLGIPFNRPPAIRIHKVEADAVVTVIPHKWRNMNHIKGTHACGLATAAEFCSGLMLLRKLNPASYRLIMQKLEVEYHYQAKADAFARFELSEVTSQDLIMGPLMANGVVFHTCTIPVHDVSGNLLCTARTTWQIKPWKDVRTK